VLAANEKPLHWIGSSKRDFLGFPNAAKDDMGNALGIAQFGGTAPTAKPWKGLGPRSHPQAFAPPRRMSSSWPGA
jgi:phage-related protein